MQTKEEVVESQAEEAAHDEDTGGEGDENTNAENGELVDTGIDQESKGISQWTINWCKFPTTIHKITPSVDYNVVKTFGYLM